MHLSKCENYLIETVARALASGEAKALGESVRGKDLFVMVDVCNYSLTYTVNGHLNHSVAGRSLSRSEAYYLPQNGKAHRVIACHAVSTKAGSISVPSVSLWTGAQALEELIDMGVSNIITFDAHDPRVQNATERISTISTGCIMFIKALLKAEPDLKLDKDHLMIISPDEGAMHRAVYFSNVLGVDMGMFYKRRDYSTIVNGKNPIVAHEFLGDDVKGKTAIIVDDMIASGESMLDVARQIKDRGASRVFVCTTFGLFTEGLEKFDDYYRTGYIDRLITTNLTYLPPEIHNRPYFIEADMSKFMAIIIDSLNHDISISSVLNPTDKIHALIAKHNAERFGSVK